MGKEIQSFPHYKNFNYAVTVTPTIVATEVLSVTVIVMFALPVPAPVTTPALVTAAVLDALEVNVNLLLSRTPVPFLKIPITFMPYRRNRLEI